MFSFKLKVGKTGTITVPTGTTVTSMVPAVCTAVIANNVLTLTGVKAGTATISITWPQALEIVLHVTVNSKRSGHQGSCSGGRIVTFPANGSGSLSSGWHSCSLRPLDILAIFSRKATPTK